MAERKTAADIDAAATSWVVREDDASFDSVDREHLQAWLAADVRHFGAYARALAVLDHARRARALGAAYEPNDFLSDGPAEAEAAPIWTRRRVVAAGAGGASLAVFASFAIGFQAAAKTFRTELGEVRLVPFDDGSSAMLNTASEIAVRYTGSRREIAVRYGEVLFDVASDTARPFAVDTGDALLMSDRTSFAVRRLAAQPTAVLVRSGSLLLKAGGSPAQRVSANTGATVSGGRIAVRSLPAAELSQQLAWQEGMLSLEDAPLRDAAAQFARYSDQRIYLADANVAARTVTGRFSTSNPREFAESAAISLGLHVSQRRDGVLIHR